MEGLEMKMAKNFWENKRILITGFEGFLGSHLTRRLISFGADVVGCDIRVHRKKTLLSGNDYCRMKVVKGDVARRPLIEKILKDSRIEYIFHLAAEAIVSRGYASPERCLRTNVGGTWSIMEAARRVGKVNGIVVASSDKAYGDQPRLPYRETDPLKGKNPYDVSKSCADLIALAYYHSYGIPVCVTRCGNIYGPGEFNFCRIVPDAIRALIKGKPFFIRSDGTFTRDYVFVDDIVRGYLLLAEQLVAKKLSGEAFNFSCGEPLTVIDLVKKIFREAGRKPAYRILNTARYEIKHQYLSAAKSRRLLGWRPQYTIEKGLRLTLAWYENYEKTP
jgi:CDP-glucose 4,6-dehydratase